MENRENKGCTPVHVINIDVEDNHEEATIGAILISDLVNLVRATFGGMNKSLIQHWRLFYVICVTEYVDSSYVTR